MKKRILSIVLVLCMVLSFVPITVFAAEGITPTTPQKDSSGVYQIGTAAELYWFADKVNNDNANYGSASAVLTADIVVNTNVLKADGTLADDTSGFTSWTPIGNSYSNRYTGKFDGQGHTISGLYFNNTNTDCVGLFGCLGSGGEIKNVGVIDSYFNGSCSVGGVCGENVGTITGCYNTGTVSGQSRVGGVCGRSQDGTITGCYNTGTVSGSGDYVGGVCGYNGGRGTITGCYSTGTVSGYMSVGGVCGYHYAGKITGCYSTGTVSGKIDVGGVCGNNYVGTISSDCAVKSDTEFADGNVCGLLNTALKNYGSDVRFYQGVKSPEFIHAPQLVDGVYQIGTAEELYGFAELVNSGNTDKNTKAVLTADIVVNKGVLKADGTLNSGTFTDWTPIGNSSNKYTGKFDGQGHTISGLYFNDTNVNYVGLFGFLGTDGEIKNVGVIDSYFRGRECVGGVCGRNERGAITGCYNTGTVSGDFTVGGVCGYNGGRGTITGCYSTGTVSGSAEVGGVSGNNNQHGTITGCYNTGKVKGDEQVGGVCGNNNQHGTITGCYTNNGGVCGTNEGGTIINDCAEYIETESENKFKDGAVCKLLNTALQNANSDVRFCQRTDTDASPLLTYQFESIDEHTYGVYTVDNNTFKATCLCGKKDTKTMELTLTTEKNVVANGEENTLTATLSNYDNETVTYKWYQNDALIENATTNTYKMPTNLSLGTYTYKVDVTMAGAGAITQSVSVFVDNDPPTGEISVGAKSWTESPDNITFDSFFKDTQTVTITAGDNSGKPVTIEYLVSHKELTTNELSNATFIAYSDTFSIDPDNEYVIYAKLTDESGNVAYISSNGIVLDSVVPVISGIENGKTYCEAQTVTVTEEYIASVTVNDVAVSLDANNQFTLNPAEGTQTIVVTDKAGNETSVTVTVNDGHTAGNDDGNCSTPVYCIYHPDTVVVAAKSHDFSGDWNKDATNHWHICQNEGCTVTDTLIPHSGTDNGDCTTAVICECGYIITAAKAEHSYGEWKSNGDGTHRHRCTVDGCDGYEDGDCAGGEATCTSKAVCDTCGEEYGELDSSNHTGSKEWETTETQHKQYWSCCDAVVVDYEDHTWNNGVCSVCGYPCSHDYDSVVTPPTCTESGYTTHTCANCGNSYVDSEVPATGHSFKFFKCVNCGMHYGCKGANCVFCSIVRWLDGLINSCEIWLTEAPVSIGKWFAGIFNCIVSAIK